jgi:hypothetical protein
VPSFDEFDAARIPVPPHRMAAPGCFETVEGQIEFESSRVKRGGMKPGSLIVKIRHHAGMDAVNALKMKHRGLIDFNARKGSTLNHENIPKKFEPTSEAIIRLRLTPLATLILVDHPAERPRKLARMQ